MIRVHNGRVWVGVGWISRRLGVHPQTVRRWLKEQRGWHKLTVLEIPDRSGAIRRYVPVDELEGPVWHEPVQATDIDGMHQRADRLRARR